MHPRMCNKLAQIGDQLVWDPLNIGCTSACTLEPERVTPACRVCGLAEISVVWPRLSTKGSTRCNVDVAHINVPQRHLGKWKRGKLKQ